MRAKNYGNVKSYRDFRDFREAIACLLMPTNIAA